MLRLPTSASSGSAAGLHLTHRAGQLAEGDPWRNRPSGEIERPTSCGCRPGRPISARMRRPRMATQRC